MMQMITRDEREKDRDGGNERVIDVLSRYGNELIADRLWHPPGIWWIEP